MGMFQSLFTCFLVLTAASLSIASNPSKLSVIVTTDCGTEIDDQWAITHLALSKKINLLGVVGNFAPNAGHGQDTAACARNILDRVGRTDVPAIIGADGPLKSVTEASVNSGTDFILKTSKKFSSRQPLIILGLGTGTDVASSLLLDSSLAKRMTYVALAFGSYPQGGDGWNVTNDVAAYQVILNSNTKVTFASGQIAEKSLTLTREQAKELFIEQGSMGEYLVRLFNKFLDDNGRYFPETEGGKHWPIWDDATTAVLLGLTQVKSYPRPAINWDATFSFPNTKSHASFKWVTFIDRNALFNDLQFCLLSKF